jgi:PhnB protein
MTPSTSSAVVSVMLIVPDAPAAMGWYKEALGATELWDLGGVAGLELDGAPFFLHEVNPANPKERGPEQVGITSVRIEVFVDDPDALIERAVRAGATGSDGVRGPRGTVGHASPGRVH